MKPEEITENAEQKEAVILALEKVIARFQNDAQLLELLDDISKNLLLCRKEDIMYYMDWDGNLHYYYPERFFVDAEGFGDLTRREVAERCYNILPPQQRTPAAAEQFEARITDEVRQFQARYDKNPERERGHGLYQEIIRFV